jgi:hypothetical protein
MDRRASQVWCPSPGLWPLALLALALAGGCDSRPAGAVSQGRLRLQVFSQESGERCPGIRVRVLAGGQVVASAVTDAQGLVDLEPEATGPLQVALDDPAGAFFPRESELAAAAEARLGLDRSLGARLPVRGADGEPLPAAAVTLWSAGRKPLDFELGPGGDFGPVPSGHARLLVAAPGHACAVIQTTLRAGRSPGSVAVLPAVRLARGGVQLRGRVLLDEGHAEARVNVRFEGVGRQAALGSDGTFIIEGLPREEGGGAMLVIERRGVELLARDVRLTGDFVDVGTIQLPGR